MSEGTFEFTKEVKALLDNKTENEGFRSFLKMSKSKNKEYSS